MIHSTGKTLLPSLKLFWKKKRFSVRAEEYEESDDDEKEEQEAEEEEEVEENACVRCSADA